MKIGYTTGVFDMFHVGHLNILKRAREHCDHLIVGVSTDELVEEYKHKRPVVPYEERAAIVGAIRYVDEVVPQVDRDKAAAQEALGFHIMFVGTTGRAPRCLPRWSRSLSAGGWRSCTFPTPAELPPRCWRKN